MRSFYGKSKKVLSIFLVLMLTVTILSGCGGKTAKTDLSTSPASNNTSSAETTQAAATTAEKPPVTIIVLARTGSLFLSGVQDDNIAKYIEKKLNIKMDVDFQGSAQKLAAMLASGTLPDLAYVEGSNNFEPMIKGGAVIDMTPLIETNGPDLQKLAGNAIRISQKFKNCMMMVEEYITLVRFLIVIFMITIFVIY